MDNPILVLAIIFAVVVVIGFFVYRNRARAEINAGPVSMSFDGSAKPPAHPAPVSPETPLDVEVTNIKTRKGAYVSDDAGGRVRVDDVDAGDDVIVTRSRQDGGAQESSPKAGPP